MRSEHAIPRSVCADCGDSIVFVGPYWDHEGKIKPKHPAFPSESGLTPQEQEVMDALVRAWEAYQKIAERSDETQEFIRAIHTAQFVLAGRGMRRLFPKYWR